MPEGTKAPYIYIVQMDIPAEHDAAFNRIYDTEHVPEILKVQTRFERFRRFAQRRCC